MNPFESSSSTTAAVIEYDDAEFHIVSPGGFVLCAVTGKQIPINALKYWNVDKQEAYIDAAAAMIGFGYGEK